MGKNIIGNAIIAEVCMLTAAKNNAAHREYCFFCVSAHFGGFINQYAPNIENVIANVCRLVSIYVNAKFTRSKNMANANQTKLSGTYLFKYFLKTHKLKTAQIIKYPKYVNGSHIRIISVYMNSNSIDWVCQPFVAYSHLLI